MDTVTWYGLVAVNLILLFYALEHRSSVFILAFAAACGMASVYGFRQGAWPFGVVEAVWSLVALRRWCKFGAKFRTTEGNWPAHQNQI
jgi:hypothetical protein